MNTLSFLDVDFKNEQAVREFLDLNSQDHEVTHSALLELGIIVEHWPLNAATPDQDWRSIHNAEHAAWSAALNLFSAPDLENVDLTDPLQAEDWNAAHAGHHARVNAALGL